MPPAAVPVGRHLEPTGTGLDHATARQMLPEFTQKIELAVARLRSTAGLDSLAAARAFTGAAKTFGTARLADATRRLTAAAEAGTTGLTTALHEETPDVASATLKALASAIPTG